jgi:hypothetical protein
VVKNTGLWNDVHRRYFWWTVIQIHEGWYRPHGELLATLTHPSVFVGLLKKMFIQACFDEGASNKGLCTMWGVNWQSSYARGQWHTIISFMTKSRRGLINRMLSVSHARIFHFLEPTSNNLILQNCKTKYMFFCRFTFLSLLVALYATWFNIKKIVYSENSLCFCTVDGSQNKH